MTFEQAVEKVIESAKRRFDYLAYEKQFIEAVGTEQGSLLAANLVRETMIGLADGKSIEDVAGDLNAQFACIGFRADVLDDCRMIANASEREQGAFVMMRVYDQMGMNPDEAFREVSKDLVERSGRMTDSEREQLETCCMTPIVESAKRSIDCYEDCRQKELAVRPEKAEARMDRIVRVALGFFSMSDDITAEQVRDYLGDKMAKGTVPEWLNEFLRECKESVAKEIRIMASMNIAWDRKMPITEIAAAVKYRLEK